MADRGLISTNSGQKCCDPRAVREFSPTEFFIGLDARLAICENANLVVRLDDIWAEMLHSSCDTEGLYFTW
jgi:hypothetical protein